MMISVIVPVFNKSNLTEQFIRNHWIYYRNKTDFELIIVDNASTDDTERIVSYYQDRFLNGKLKYIRNTINYGFSIANNIGVSHSTGDILVFINNDVLIQADYLSKIENALMLNSNQLIGCQLLNSNTGWNLFYDKSGKEVLVSYLAGWFVSGKKDIFSKLDYWDERYTPCDYEDLDLSYKATKHNIPLNILDLPLYHISGQTASQLPDRQFITRSNRIKFANKWELATDA